jgi:hypothetical protein
MLKALAQAGASPARIASKLNRTISAVRRRGFELGFKRKICALIN